MTNTFEEGKSFCALFSLSLLCRCSVCPISLTLTHSCRNKGEERTNGRSFGRTVLETRPITSISPLSFVSVRGMFPACLLSTVTYSDTLFFLSHSSSPPYDALCSRYVSLVLNRSQQFAHKYPLDDSSPG